MAEWITILISVINQNKVLFNTLFVPICGISSRVVAYARDLVNKQTIQGFDESIHSDLKKIISFAEQFKIPVSETFLQANMKYSTLLDKYRQQIPKLNDDQLETLKTNMEVLKDMVIENEDFLRRAVKNLEHTLSDFVALTKSIGETMHNLQLTVKFIQKNRAQKRSQHVEELKSQIIATKNMLTSAFKENIQKNIKEINSEIEYANNLNVLQQIEEVISGRKPQPDHGVASTSPNQQILQNASKIKKSGKVQDLIAFFENFKNQVTLHQLLNQAKHDSSLRDLLKKDKIIFYGDDKEFVRKKIADYELKLRTMNAKSTRKNTRR